MEDKNISLIILESELQVLFTALSELPVKISLRLIQKIENQFLAQQKEIKEVTK